METVRDADVWLALHEGPLHNEKQKVSISKNIMLLSDFVHTRYHIVSSQVKAGNQEIYQSFSLYGVRKQ